MKATLATLACLLTVGFLSAAEVTGNNTAVVIRKNVVESDTHYQFLCVPVDGLDIANGTQKTVKLSTVLPASTLKNGSKVIFVGGNLTNVTPTVSDGNWSADPDLTGGQIFWLRTPEETAPAATMSLSRTTTTVSPASATPATVIFCGQDRALTKVTPVAGQVTAMANDSSKPLALVDVVANPGDLDTILVIQAGSSDYKQYNAFDGKWYGPNGADADTDTIAPGEAFYYFKR